MKDEEGHFNERRTDYSKELQMFVKRGQTVCGDCPFEECVECSDKFESLFHISCFDIDLSTLEVHGL